MVVSLQKKSSKMLKVTIPHKIHVFLWLLFRNKLLTRDKLARLFIKSLLRTHICNVERHYRKGDPYGVIFS